MRVDLVPLRHRHPPDGQGGPNHSPCWMRDPDGYTVVAASPYGTADDAWRPGPIYSPRHLNRRSEICLPLADWEDVRILNVISSLRLAAPLAAPKRKAILTRRDDTAVNFE